MRNGTRNTLIALAASGAIIAAGGGALALADDPTPSGPSSSADKDAPGMRMHGDRGAMLHGEMTVERDGKVVDLRMQRGTVSAVSATSLTVKSSDGFSATYVVNDSTQVRTGPGRHHLDEQAVEAAETIDAISVGDDVMVFALVQDGSATAEHVGLVPSDADLAAMHEQMGRMRGPGHGHHGMGPGRGMGPQEQSPQGQSDDQPSATTDPASIP